MAGKDVAKVGDLFDLYLTKMIENEKAVRHMLDERDKIALDLKGATNVRTAQIQAHLGRLDVQIDHFMKRVEMYARLVKVVGKAI